MKITVKQYQNLAKREQRIILSEFFPLINRYLNRGKR